MTDVPNTPAAPVIDPPAPPQGEAPTTFTQDDVNRLLAENKRTLRAELEAAQAKLADLAPKAEEFDRIKAEQMTALEKAQAEIAERDARLLDIETRAKAAERTQAAKDAALKVATELGVNVDAAMKLAPKLDGDTAEEFEAAARELFPVLKPSEGPLPSAVHDVQPPDDKAAEKAAFFGR